MKINVANLQKDEIIGVEFQANNESLGFADGKSEVFLKEPAQVKANVEKIGDSIWVTGTITACMKLRCSRCLDEYEAGGRTDLKLEYRKAQKYFPAEREDLDLKDEDLDFLEYQGGEIDLAEGIRQNILLSLPMKPLCRDDCYGLCSGCGRNLNNEKCICEKQIEK